VTRFIDVHVHPPLPEVMSGVFGPFTDSLDAAFGREIGTMTAGEIADLYRGLDGKAVLLAWDAETATGRRPFTNEQVAALVAEHPDVFLGFGSVDPHKGAAAVGGVHQTARLGLAGLKFHPPAQRFSPADRLAYPVWEAAESHGLPVMLHTGYTAMGQGMAGGGGIELRYADPMLADKVAVDFPDLQIILAHTGWPWHEAAVAVARHKRNVHIELSGWPPSRLPEVVVEAVRGPLTDRTLFGTDFPFLTPERWIAGFERLGLSEETNRAVLFGNAERLLGMA